MILDLGYVTDPATGKLQRKQKWITFRGTKKQAGERLTEWVRSANRGEFVEPSKMTLGVWLTDWLDKAVKPPLRRPATYARYKGIVENHILKSALASIPLQKLRGSDIERYYADSHAAPATLAVHHAVLHRALRKAVKDRLLTVNVASDLDGRPKPSKTGEDARQHAWTAQEARTFLATAKTSGPQAGAFYALALDTGARKGELCGLQWRDVDLDAPRVALVQQLTKPGPVPVFGPPKNGRPRTITIAAETVELLRAHKRHQAELKMANRATYHDHGLVFAKEWGELQRQHDVLGDPLQMNNLGQRSFAKLTKAAGVRPIKFHGLRHTCATLLLQAGEPVHVVSDRLGHKGVEITLNIYAHVLPDMQQQAAATLGALLHV